MSSSDSLTHPLAPSDSTPYQISGSSGVVGSSLVPNLRASRRSAPPHRLDRSRSLVESEGPSLRRTSASLTTAQPMPPRKDGIGLKLERGSAHTRTGSCPQGSEDKDGSEKSLCRELVYFSRVHGKEPLIRLILYRSWGILKVCGDPSSWPYYLQASLRAQSAKRDQRVRCGHFSLRTRSRKLGGGQPNARPSGLRCPLRIGVRFAHIPAVPGGVWLPPRRCLVHLVGRRAVPGLGRLPE